MSVIRGAGYILAHVPDMILSCGTTQTTERKINPESDYLRAVGAALRKYDDVVAYAPNQVYIGAAEPEVLREMEIPWYDKPYAGAGRFGKFGEIMPQDELLLLMRTCDTFELVLLADTFIEETLPRFKDDPIIDGDIISRVGAGAPLEEITSLIAGSGAQALYHKGAVVGCVKRAHDIDENLSAHVMLENIASKATATLALLYGLRNSGVSKAEIEYLIDCSEEACGDMNQRGGGGLSKSVAEAAGLSSATGADLRGFCAAPAHAVVTGAALVASGVFKAVAVTAGGSTAKLGMNGKDHIKKGLPILEDVMGGFSVIITQNDGISPEIDLSVVGRHTVATGSSPQAVISSLVTAPLERAGMKILDVDIFASEMQNPDVTKPAGAGDVPLANYKMIGALAVMQGELKKDELTKFIAERGLPGWAPTQGHIPSGIPLLGFARERIMEGKLKNAMLIGKGSLFLGRMTNLFDGVSFLIKANESSSKSDNATKNQNNTHPPSPTPVSYHLPPTPYSRSFGRIAVAGLGSELGEKAVADACAAAVAKGYDVCYLGIETVPGAVNITCSSEDACVAEMSRLLSSGECGAAVAMHHTFPIGTATVGRVVTPARGREMYIATTTGTPSAGRVEALVLGALYGIITARSCGISSPSVGLLNIDGARKAETALRKLRDGGFPIDFARSARADGGAVMRGNDILLGTADVLVCDPLTGNALIKMLSAFNSGGDRECSGYGYGPGIGKDIKNPVLIVSRASDTPVIFNAIRFAAEVSSGGLSQTSDDVFAQADKCGLRGILAAQQKEETSVQSDDITPPEREPVTEEIPGIEVMDIEEAARLLWKDGVYAESAMGCTGPVIMVSESNFNRAAELLRKAGYIE